jgi:lipopolysaccharide export system permease protein
MEGHYRLASPLLNLSFVIIGLAILLSGQFNRRGQLKRVVGSVGVVMVIEAGLVGLKSGGQDMPELTGLMYLCPLLPAAFGGYVLLVRDRLHRRHPASQPG